MKFIADTTWSQIFEGWRQREENNPGWVRCATEVKGWPDWQSWRQHTANQIDAEQRQWQIFEFTDPINEIPAMLLGPYSGWQSRVTEKNKASFEDLLNLPEQYQHFSQYEPVLSILRGLPFATEFIGLIRDDNQQIVCLEGHHRATAVALAKKQGKQIDFSKTSMTIALAHLSKEECHQLDEMLARGTTKNPEK